MRLIFWLSVFDHLKPSSKVSEPRPNCNHSRLWTCDNHYSWMLENGKGRSRRHEPNPSIRRVQVNPLLRVKTKHKPANNRLVLWLRTNWVRWVFKRGKNGQFHRWVLSKVSESIWKVCGRLYISVLLHTVLTVNAPG